MIDVRRTAAILLALSLFASNAAAFVHVVQKGETLASIAERFYGRIQHEQILVAANGLEAQGGVPIVAGMRLEVPTVSYRRIKKGDTWAALATELLGGPLRAEGMAEINGSHAWLPPELGAEVIVPYNLHVVATRQDTINSLAFKYLGDAKKAWSLNHYNGFKERAVRSGDVVLIPLSDLPLTEEGKRAAASAAALAATEAQGETRQAQRRVASEIPALMADVRNGRYVDAVSRGMRFLSSGDLSAAQLGIIHRQLLEAYTALGATGRATAACSAWRRHDPNAKLDPVWMSPKLIAACSRTDAAPP